MPDDLPHDLDTDLLARAQHLESAALNEIHQRYFTRIYQYAYVRTGNSHTAEDIASETFVSLLDSFNKGRPPHTTLRGWLFGVAAHLVADHFDSKPVSQLTEFQADGFSTQVVVEERLRRAGVQDAVRRLTADQQEVLALRFTSGLSVEETARQMGRTVTAVKALQFRAVDALRQMLAEVENE
jgi:RNA polymerase sigma-70 factor (ECF subfamily)